MESTIINITNNLFKKTMFFVKDNYYDLQPSINPPCFFQFYKFQDQKDCQNPIVFITSTLAPDVFSDFAGNINTLLWTEST